MTEPALVAEPIRAWRRAFVTDDGFSSIAIQGTFGPGWSDATCVRGRVGRGGLERHEAPSSHPVPSETCKCGWYACADRAALVPAISPAFSTGNATLRVELAGRVIEWEVRGHDSVGYRAARQRVLSVAMDRRCAHGRCETAPVGVAWPDGWPACGDHAADDMRSLAAVAARLGVPVAWGDPPFPCRGVIDLEAVAAFGQAMSDVVSTMAEAGARLAKAMSAVAQTLATAGGTSAVRQAAMEAEERQRARAAVSSHRPGVEHAWAYRAAPVDTTGDLRLSDRGEAAVNALAAKRVADRRRRERLEGLDRRHRRR